MKSNRACLQFLFEYKEFGSEGIRHRPTFISDKLAPRIMRKEETARTRSLLNTAKLMEENSMLFKLKEMEYVEKIADKISSISVSGNGVLIEQLKQIFVPQK